MMVHKILVVEDNSEQKNIIRSFIETTVGIVGWVDDNSSDAIDNIINNVRVNGVIKDLHLPVDCGGNAEQPKGFRIAAYCAANAIPCVVCTDGNGHKFRPKYGWLEEGLEYLGIPIVLDKDWGEALRLLKEKIENK